jgi:phage/plasmid-like protein (TIGR03299 family)
MAHNITATDAHINFVTPAWHSLGVTLPDDHPARYDWEQMICAGGQTLAWDVALGPIQLQAAMPASDTSRFEVTPGVAGATVPGHYAVYRKDTNDIFTVVGKRYHPLQNADLFRWFQPYLDTREVRFETAGSLFGGRCVWALAEIQRDPLTIITDSRQPDVVRKYLTLIGTHDMSARTRAGMTPTRIVCWNTLSAALQEKESTFVGVRHTKNQVSQLEVVRETINLMDQRFELTAQSYRAMARAGLTKDQIVKFVKDVFGKDVSEELSTRSQNILDAVVANVYNAPGSAMAGETVWGAYNAVTQHLTHTASREVDTRLASQWYGDASIMNRRALELAMDLVA